jgi:hypothetical protein
MTYVPRVAFDEGLRRTLEYFSRWSGTATVGVASEGGRA